VHDGIVVSHGGVACQDVKDIDLVRAETLRAFGQVERSLELVLDVQRNGDLVGVAVEHDRAGLSPADDGADPGLFGRQGLLNDRVVEADIAFLLVFDVLMLAIVNHAAVRLDVQNVDHYPVGLADLERARDQNIQDMVVEIIAEVHL